MAAKIDNTTKYILSQCFAPSTIATYRRALHLYTEYCTETAHGLPYFPLTNSDAMNFIAYLYLREMTANTISTYITGLASVNKLYRGEDIFQAFLIKKLLAGVHRLSGTANQRLPI